MYTYLQYTSQGCGHLIQYMYIPSTDPPKVLSFTPTDTTVVAGDIVTLNCSYEGNPSPTVSWSQNETMLDPASDPNLSETLNDGYALLEVTFADINDTGSYGCGLQNIINMSNSEFFFHTVQGTCTYNWLPVYNVYYTTVYECKCTCVLHTCTYTYYNTVHVHVLLHQLTCIYMCYSMCYMYISHYTYYCVLSL